MNCRYGRSEGGAVEHTRIICPHCGISRYRASHFRWTDLPFVFRFQLPVRCHSCQERFHIRYREAFRQSRAQKSRSFLVMEAEDLRTRPLVPPAVEKPRADI